MRIHIGLADGNRISIKIFGFERAAEVACLRFLAMSQENAGLTAAPTAASDENATPHLVSMLPITRPAPDANGASSTVDGDQVARRISTESVWDSQSGHEVGTSRCCTRQKRRFSNEKADSVGHASSSGPSADRESESAEQPTAAGERLPDRCTANALRERAERMFLGDGEVPRASGHGAAAIAATVELILAANEAIQALWKAKQEEIRRRCAPSLPTGLIDRQEVFGYVLADALGRPLLPPDAARRIGQNGDNAVKGADGTRNKKGKLARAREAAAAALRSARRAAKEDSSKLPGVEAAEKAGQAGVTSVLRSIVDLKLPAATVGKRKRVAEPPTDAELLAEACAAVAAAEAAEKKAENAEEAAFGAHNAARDAYQAARAAYDAKYDAHQEAGQPESGEAALGRAEAARDAADAEVIA